MLPVQYFTQAKNPRVDFRVVNNENFGVSLAANAYIYLKVPFKIGVVARTWLCLYLIVIYANPVF